MEKKDFFSNIGGLNITDSPFYVGDNQSTGGYNYEYLKTGGITKRRGHQKLNAAADANTRTLGMGVHTSTSSTRTALRATQQKLKSIDLSTGTNTAIAEDTTVAATDIFGASSEQPVVFSTFNGASSNITWLAGGGASNVYGYNGTKITKNGIPTPTGTFSGVVSVTGGSWQTTGTYYYAIAFRKASTQAISNAALDFQAVIANTTDKVTITLPTVDTTKYDQFYIYRSAVAGVTNFTTGFLVAQVATTSATHIDTGTVLGLIDNIPRVGYPILDNGELPSGTYKVVTTWKNQLVTAKGNTIYISDLLKSESWPLNKNYTITGAGEIKALGVINFNSRSTANMDEYLCIWDDRKMWIIEGSGIYDADLGTWDIAIRYVDSIGSVGQSTVVNAYGNILWMDVSGIYSWDATGKPTYISRLIEASFSSDGDFDRSQAYKAVGVFFRKQKQIHFFYPHRTEGINKASFVVDGRLTFMNIGSGDAGTVSDAGVFTQNLTSVSIYGACSILTSSVDEYLLIGDDNGFVYNALRLGKEDVPTSVDSTGDVGIEFDYYTRWLDMGSPSMAKRFNKVIVYVETYTPDNLTLEYWADYRVRDDAKSTISASMGTRDKNGTSLWDVAFWDSASWDDYAPRIIPITYNLNSSKNNGEGDAIRLRFKQFDESVPVTIVGFSVLYSEIAMRK